MTFRFNQKKLQDILKKTKQHSLGKARISEPCLYLADVLELPYWELKITDLYDKEFNGEHARTNG
jgi:hypothetical protein